MYSWLTSINSSIICVRYSLLINGLEIPMVNGAPSAPGASVAASVAGASVAAASVGASVAGMSVGSGASVAGAPQAAIRDAIVMKTVTNKTSFLLFLDIFIFSLILSRVYKFCNRGDLVQDTSFFHS